MPGNELPSMQLCRDGIEKGDETPFFIDPAGSESAIDMTREVSEMIEQRSPIIGSAVEIIPIVESINPAMRPMLVAFNRHSTL